MDETPPPVIAPRRLNPFAFPAETDVRFILLVVTALMVAITFGRVLRFALAADYSPAPAKANFTAESTDEPDEFFQRQKARSAAFAASAWQELALPTLLSGVLLGLATVRYRRHPGRLRKRFHLEPLRPEKAPTFYSEVQTLSARAGIDPVPQIEMNPGLKSQSGQAFGLRGTFSLRLDGGLKLLLLKSPETFRALVLHELGHIVNRDVGRTYFAEAIWHAAIGIVLVPLAIASAVVLWQGQSADFNLVRLLTRNLPALLWLWFQAGVIIVVMATMRASVLRCREFYADSRAATWGGTAALAALFRKYQESDPQEKAARWKSFWRLHPTATERLAALENPGVLFQAGNGLPFLVGFLVAMTIEGVLSPALALALGLSAFTGGLADGAAGDGNLGTAKILVLFSFLLAGVIVCTVLAMTAWLLVGTVGAQVQRQAVGGLAMTQLRRGLAAIVFQALLVAAGMEAGFAMVPGLFGIKGLADVPAAIPAFLLFAAWAWLCLAFSRFGGLRLLGSKTGRKPPVAARRWLALMGSVAGGLALTPVLIGGFLLMRGALFEQRQFMLEVVAVFSGLSLLLYAAAFLFHGLAAKFRPSNCPECRKPLPAGLVPGGGCPHCGSNVSPWLFLEPAGASPRESAAGKATRC